ncbi:MAG TPA: preprotein translocase subunit YajC [Propionibacteriaceae bacterium]|nr:preprotein translocase subunit YajC [Propionibacteriaceae bacterium]
MQQYTTLILIALMVVAFYFLIMRPQKKRQQAIQKTMNELQPGTRVMLGSGLFGTLVSVGTKQVVLEVSPGVEMTVLKQAIARTVAPGDEDSELDELEEYDDSEVIEEEPSSLDSTQIEPTTPEPPASGSAGADQRPSSAN